MSHENTNFPLTHFLIAVIFSSLLLFLSLSGRLNWLTSPIINIFIPLRFPFTQINRSANHLTTQLRDIPNQQRLIKDLQRQNAALSVLAQQNQQLQSENDALKRIVRSPIASGHRLISTQVIGISRFAYVNHGSNDGLRVGQPAVVDDILLGIVHEVSANSAKIKLLTDNPNLNVTTSLLSTGTLGLDGDHLVIKEVLQKQPLQVDDRVFTTGSELIPSGLLIGTVIEIKSNPSSVYQTAVIKPSTSLSDHQTVFIVLD